MDDRIKLLENELAEMSRRLKGTVHEVSQMKWIVFAMTLFGVSLLGAFALLRTGVIEAGQLIGSALPKKLEAKEFGMYNREGKRVLFADYDKWGYPSLVFLNLDLDYKMGLKIYPDDGGTPGMVFYDKTGTRALFRMGENGEALINLLGANKKGGIALSVAEDGSPTLKLTDATGKVLFEAPTPSAGSLAPPPLSESLKEPPFHPPTPRG